MDYLELANLKKTEWDPILSPEGTPHEQRKSCSYKNTRYMS